MLANTTDRSSLICRHTISAAYACFLDHDLGSLSAGKYADFAVLPANSGDEFLNDLPSSVLATYVNGVQAYPRNS